MMNPLSTRARRIGGLIGVAALVFSCTDPTSSNLERNRLKRVTSGPSNAFGDVNHVTVCKVGSSASFDVRIDGVLQPPLTLADGACKDTLYENGVLQSFDATETGSPIGFKLDSIVVDALVTDEFGDNAVHTRTVLTGATSASLSLSPTTGGTLTFYNSSPPPATPCPAGSFIYSFNLAGDLLIKYDQFPAPNDNSYGVNAVGWFTRGHRFSDLVGSDHAGFQLTDGGNVVRLSFNVDYITAVATAPSGYASLGVTGGDGSMLVGTSTGITATSSLANNLNNINIPGLFSATHVQQFGSVNVLVDSPPTDAAHLTYVNSDAALAGWDFHDTYYVTISAAKLASIGFDPGTWHVAPNAAQLHNSPAKACPTPGGICSLAVTKTEFRDRELKITIANNGSTDVVLSDLVLAWATANGKLKQVKLDKDLVYDSPDIAGGSAHLTLAELIADSKKRRISAHSSDVLTLVFEKRADTDLTHYVVTASFGDCVVQIGAAPPPA